MRNNNYEYKFRVPMYNYTFSPKGDFFTVFTNSAVMAIVIWILLNGLK